MRVAVIGLGVMGRNHQRVLTELGCDVVSVDPAGHADHTRIEAAAPFDAACISTPPARLPDAAFEAADYTDRLLIEKPLAPTLAQASALAARLPDAWVGYVERFNPVLPVLEDLLPSLGEIRSVRVKRLGLEQRNDLGAWRDLATHDLDLLESLRIPLTRCEFEVGYGRSEKVREWEIQTEATTIYADWQKHTVVSAAASDRTINAVVSVTTEPLVAQWRAFLHGAKAPVDTRIAVQILREAVRLEHDLAPIAA